MLKQLFEIQKNVLDKKYDDKLKVAYLASLRDEMARISEKITNDYLPQIERMIKDSEQLQRNLLDLLRASTEGREP